jgi:hypothetical protein
MHDARRVLREETVGSVSHYFEPDACAAACANPFAAAPPDAGDASDFVFPNLDEDCAEADVVKVFVPPLSPTVT